MIRKENIASRGLRFQAPKATIDYPLSRYISAIAWKTYRIIRWLLNWRISAVSVISAFRRSLGRCAGAAWHRESLLLSSSPCSLSLSSLSLLSLNSRLIPPYNRALSRVGDSRSYFLDRSICTSPRSRIIDERVIGWPRSTRTYGDRKGWLGEGAGGG